MLEELRSVHPAIEPILDWRTYTKLRSTYVEALPVLIASDGRVHTSFNQTVAGTGRLSSATRTFRTSPSGRSSGGGFGVPSSPGNWDVAPLRGLQPDRVEDACPRDRRPHSGTPSSEGTISTRQTAEVYGIPISEVTSGERRIAKTVNFGVLYGMSDYGLARGAGSPGKRPRCSSRITSRGTRGRSSSTGYTSRGRSAGLREHSARTAGATSRSCVARCERCGWAASGWPSTCRSRARPPTS